MEVVWAEIGLAKNIANSNMNIFLFVMFSFSKKILPAKREYTLLPFWASSLALLSKSARLKEEACPLFTWKEPLENR